MNTLRSSITRALPLVLFFGLVTLSCAQEGPHIIYTGPGAGAFLNASGGVVNQPNAVGVIAPPNPVAGVFDFNFQGTLNGFPNPDPFGAGWGLVAPFVPPPGTTVPGFGPGGDANLPFTPNGLLQLNFDPVPGNVPGTPPAPVFIVYYDPSGAVVDANGVKVDVVPLEDSFTLFGFSVPTKTPGEQVAETKFGQLQSGSNTQGPGLAAVREEILKNEEAIRLQERQFWQAQDIKDAQEQNALYLKSQALGLKEHYYGGIYVPFNTRIGVVAVRTARVGELVQSLAFLNLLIAGTGEVPEGNFLTVAPGEAVKHVEGLTKSIAGGQSDLSLFSYLATPGVVDDASFTSLRADYLETLYETAQQLQVQQIALDDAKRKKDEAVSQLTTAVRAGPGFAEAGVAASKRFDKSVEEIAAIQAERLKLLNGNALLTVPVKVGEFEGPLWQALIEFSGNDTLSQLAINEALPILTNHIRNEIIRIGGLTTTEGLIGEFGSPVYTPLRDAILADKTFNASLPSSVVRGVADVRNAYGHGNLNTATSEKLTDAAFTIGGGIVVIGAVVFTGPVGAAVVTGAGAVLGTAETGVAGYQLYNAYNATAAAESAVGAGGSVSNQAAQDFRGYFNGRAITFAITALVSVVDVVEVKGAVKAVRGAASETAETAATAGVKAGPPPSKPLAENAPGGQTPPTLKNGEPPAQPVVANAPNGQTPPTQKIGPAVAANPANGQTPPTVKGANASPAKTGGAAADATPRGSRNDYVRVPVDETKFTPSAVPGPNTLWTHPETGEKFLIGRQLGQGVYNTVFELADQPGLVIKFPNKVLSPPPGTDALGKLELVTKAQDEVVELVEGSNHLADAGIPQLKIVDANSTSDLPYVITEKLDPAKHSTVTYEALESQRAELIAAGKWTQDHERAVVELYDSLANKNLVWGDGHANNIYFFTGTDGKLHAGVLDHDQITPLDQVSTAVENRILRNPGVKVGEVTAHQAGFGALNAKLWITPLLDGSGYATNFLDPSILREFPGFAPFVAGKELAEPTVFPKLLVTPSLPARAPAPSVVRDAVTFAVTEVADEVVKTNPASSSTSSANTSPASAQPIVIPAAVNEARHQNDVQNAKLPKRQPSPGRRIKLGSLIPQRQKATSTELALAN